VVIHILVAFVVTVAVTLALTWVAGLCGLDPLDAYQLVT
jgi:hypothetical protein